MHTPINKRVVFPRDQSPITIKKTAKNLEALQSELDLVKSEIQNQIIRQNDFRLRTIQRDVGTGDVYIDLQLTQKELLQAKMLIQQLQSENITLLNAINSMEQERSLRKIDPEQSDEIKFLRMEIKRLSNEMQQLIEKQGKQKQPENQTQSAPQSSKEIIERDQEITGWKEKCNNLLSAHEEILSSNTQLLDQIGEISRKAKQMEQINEQQKSYINQLSGQVQSLQIQLLDRDNQISSLKQIMSANPKVTIKFPPCLKMTTTMGSPIRESRSPSPQPNLSQYTPVTSNAPMTPVRGRSQVKQTEGNGLFIRDGKV